MRPRPPVSPAAIFVLGLQFLTAAAAPYELYNDPPVAMATGAYTDETGNWVGLPAYDPLELTVPPLPENVVRELAVTVPASPDAAALAGLNPSIGHKGNFLGFSIELSVASSLMGSSGDLLSPTFLNYMDTLRQRSKAGPTIRVGGNSQEGSTLQVGMRDPTEKFKSDLDTPTSTPIINFSDELFRVMANISSLVNAEWFFGLSYNQTAVETKSLNVPLVVQHATEILGSNLLGLSMGNEPDLYQRHHKRPETYTVTDYLGEFTEFRDFVQQNSHLDSPMQLTGPAVCCNEPGFELWDVFNTGWLEQNLDYLASVTVQRYPANNCKIDGKIINPQDIFPSYLTHQSAMDLTGPYIESANRVVASGKEFVMMEFNTASCGGFPGLSDNFGAALWLTDWSLQMAWGNFSHALMHVGGQNVYYNPFTPPPWNYSAAGWTTGSVYYSALVMTEILGSSNTSQVVDYLRGLESVAHPTYLIYENGAPARIALFNFLSDAAGNADYTATIAVDGLALDHVSVRYLAAPNVADKWNISWAGQTMGKSFEGDGRLRGDLATVRVPCTDNKCLVRVPGPSLAVVFLSDAALEGSTAPPEAPAYTTTMLGVGRGAAINKDLVEHGNGVNPDWRLVYGSSPRRRTLTAGIALAGVVISLIMM